MAVCVYVQGEMTPQQRDPHFMTTSSWTAGSKPWTLDLFWPFHHCHVSPGTLTSLGHPRLHMQGHQDSNFQLKKETNGIQTHSHISHQ